MRRRDESHRSTDRRARNVREQMYPSCLGKLDTETAGEKTRLHLVHRETLRKNGAICDGRSTLFSAVEQASWMCRFTR